MLPIICQKPTGVVTSVMHYGREKIRPVTSASVMHYRRDKIRSCHSVMHYGRDKIITDVTLKLALIDQLTQLKVFKLKTPQLTFDLCPELDLLI